METVFKTVRRRGVIRGVGTLCVLAIGLLVGASMSGASNTRHHGPKTQAAGSPIIIGAAIAKSGFMAIYDGPPNAAIKIAIAQINAKGGVLGRKLQYIDSDNKTDVAESATAAADVIGRGANIVVTSCDFDFGAPAALAAQKKNLLSFSTCAGSLNFGPRGIGPLAFTMANSSETQGAAIAEWGYQKRGLRSAYVITNPGLAFEKELCDAFATRWKQLGGKVLGRDTVQQNDTNFSSQISRIRRLKSVPSVIYLCTPQPQLASILRQVRAAGIKSAVFGEPGFDGNNWKKAVPNASNVYFPAVGSIFGDDPNPRVNAFVRLYTKTVGSAPPSAYALTGYSVVEAVVRAIRATNSTDGTKLAAALEKFNNVQLLVGHTTFTKKWHIALHRDVTIMGVTKGKTHFVTKRAPKVVPLPKGY